MNENQNKNLIYIVEDDEAIRELISYAVEGEGYNYKAFDNAIDMLAECKNTLPHLILLDIMLPNLDGVEALKKFRENFSASDTRIILVTAKNSEIHRIQGLDAGADDYVVKPFSVLELLARVRANLRKSGGSVNDIGELIAGNLKLCLNTRVVFSSENKIDLTHREFELLKFLMLNAGAVVDREKILQEVWGYEYTGESRTVDIHIKNLRQKLGDNGEKIESVRGIGYRIG